MNKFDVVAAIIIKNNKFFIAQRNRHKHMGLSWEFPGGKVEKGETFEVALKREIKEELNIDIDIKNKLGEENYQDNKINVKLHYYICSHISGDIYFRNTGLGGTLQSHFNTTFLDEPASQSQLTYHIQFRAPSGTARIGSTSGASLIAMEVLA